VLRDNPVYHLLVRNDLRSRFLANFLIADFSPIWIGSGEAAIDLILHPETPLREGRRSGLNDQQPAVTGID
jgi:hypothetical protein